MQMRKYLYETLDRVARANRLRADSIELGRRGYPVLAEVCREEAEILDPPVREDGVTYVRVRRDTQRQRRA